MGRGRSFLVLLVLAVGLGAYIWFIERNRDLTDPATKKEKIFAIDASKIEEIEVRAASGEVTRIKKSGSEWQIAAPEAMEADQAEVSSLVTTLETLEAQRTLDPNPSSVKEFELDPPRFSVGVRLAGETAMRRVQVGSKTPTGADLYARVEGQPRLILLSSYVEDSLNRTPFDLREKSVLKFARDGVDSVVLEAAGNPALALAKKADQWRLTKPLDARADSGAVEGLIGKITQTKMKAIVAPDGTKELKKYGLDKPQAVATFGAGSTRATLALGAKVDDTAVYARDLSRPMVFTVETSLLDDLKRKADDLRIKDVFEFRSFTAQKVDVTLGGQSFTFEKQKAAGQEQSTAAEVWKQTKPAAKDVDQTKLTDLLTGLSNLRADKFADRAFATGDELAVTARFGEAASPSEERVVFRKSAGVVHAIRAGEAGAAVVPTADFDKTVALIKELTGAK